MQVAIALVSRQQDWTLWRLPWWFWLVLIVPEAILFAALALSWPRRAIEQYGRRREVTLALFAHGRDRQRRRPAGADRGAGHGA